MAILILSLLSFSLSGIVIIKNLKDKHLAQVDATEVDEIYISTEQELIAFAEDCYIKGNDGNYTANVYLLSDLDMAGLDFYPIGTRYSESEDTLSGNAWFYGNFYGMGYTIKNITINYDFTKKYESYYYRGGNYIGFFACLAGTVTGLKLQDMTITSNFIYPNGNDRAVSCGAIAGCADSAIIDGCVVENLTIKASSDYVGGASRSSCAGALVGNDVRGQFYNSVESTALQVSNCYIDGLNFSGYGEGYKDLSETYAITDAFSNDTSITDCVVRNVEGMAPTGLTTWSDYSSVYTDIDSARSCLGNDWEWYIPVSYEFNDGWPYLHKDSEDPEQEAYDYPYLKFQTYYFDPTGYQTVLSAYRTVEIPYVTYFDSWLGTAEDEIEEITLNLNNKTVWGIEAWDQPGYNFVKWKKNEALDKNAYVPDYSLIIYTITYNLDGGTNHPDNPTTCTVENGITLENPTKSGYNFIGWTGSNGTTPEWPIVVGGTSYETEELTFTANWEERGYYIIEYDLNGGSLPSGQSNPLAYEQGDSFTLINPSWAGYTFDGWTGSNGTTPEKEITIKETDTGDRYYKANWSGAEYVYKLLYTTYDSGYSYSTTFKEGTYEIGDTVSITAPTRSGYEFDCWVSGSISNGQAGSITIKDWLSQQTTFTGYGDFWIEANYIRLTNEVTFAKSATTGNSLDVKIDVYLKGELIDEKVDFYKIDILTDTELKLTESTKGYTITFGSYVIEYVLPRKEVTETENEIPSKFVINARQFKASSGQINTFTNFWTYYRYVIKGSGIVNLDFKLRTYGVEYE